MLLTPYCSRPLSRSYVVIISMLVRLQKMKIAPAELSLHEAMPEDFWSR